MTKTPLWKQIKDDIRQDKLPIDQLLTQQWLSDHYKVSRIPVRDAIQRLSLAGWFIAHGKKGVQIPPLNAAQAQELYLMRMPLEALALELSFDKINFAVLGRAEDILTQLTDTTSLSPLEQGVLNLQFHYCLYQACERPTLLRTLTQLHEQCERYLGFQAHTLDYHSRSEAEHYQLLKALRDKELGLAQQILKRHIEQAGEILVAHLEGC